jgi:PKD repeat protein
VAIWIETFEDKAISDWLREDLNADGTTWTDANPYGRASAFLDTTFAVCDNTGFLNQSNDAMTSPVVDATGYVDLDLRYGQSFLKEALMGNPETGTVQVTGGSGWETVGTVQETLEGEVRVDLAASYDETAAFQVKFAYQNTSLFSDGFWGVDNVALYGMPSGPPQAAFSGTPRSGPAPLEVSFINETMGIYETCAWDFGDGQAGEGDAPIHVFAEPGLYTVSMTVTGPGGEDTETQEGYIEVTAEGDDTDDDTGPADDDDSGGDDDDDNDDDGCGC